MAPGFFESQFFFYLFELCTCLWFDCNMCMLTGRLNIMFVGSLVINSLILPCISSNFVYEFNIVIKENTLHGVH